MASVYDFVFGPLLHAGRRAAIEAMAIQPGERILEVGVGTGITFDFYPRGASVVGIDLSAPMLDRARERLAARVETDTWCVARMNAERLAFADGAFDIVYAPYVMSVVPDPIAVGREMLRVCRPGGRIVILNHFASRHPMARAIERRASRLTRRVGFRTDLSLESFIAQTGLTPARIEKLNLFNISTLVACVRT